MDLELLFGKDISPTTYVGDEFIDSYSKENRYIYLDVKLIDNELFYTREIDIEYIASQSWSNEGIVRENYYEKEVKMPYSYTGKIFILENDDIHGYYVDGYGIPWWCARSAFEINFENGHLIEKTDRSQKMATIFKTIVNSNNFKKEYEEDFNMFKFLKNNIEYKNTWWLDNLLNGINTKIKRIV